MDDTKDILKLTEAGRKFIEESIEYESPITKMCGQIQEAIIKQDEEHLMYSVNQAVGYQVDKEELIKALQYDRDQYRKGYMDCRINISEKVKQAKEEIYNLVDLSSPMTPEKQVEMLLNAKVLAILDNLMETVLSESEK